MSRPPVPDRHLHRGTARHVPARPPALRSRLPGHRRLDVGSITRAAFGGANAQIAGVAGSSIAITYGQVRRVSVADEAGSVPPGRCRLPAGRSGGPLLRSRGELGVVDSTPLCVPVGESDQGPRLHLVPDLGEAAHLGEPAAALLPLVLPERPRLEGFLDLGNARSSRSASRSPRATKRADQPWNNLAWLSTKVTRARCFSAWR